MPWWAILFFALVGAVWVTVCILAWIDEYRHRDEYEDSDDAWRDDYTGWG